MKTKSLSFMGILLSAVLMSSMFLVGITASEFPPDPQGAYSPWGDLNDDGEINIFDLVWMAGRYGTSGTPVNKTALLYNVSDTFIELLAMIGSMNSTIAKMNTTINNLNNTIIYLNETVTILCSTKLGAPDYDSGWVNLNIGSNRFDHNLNTTNLLVYMVGNHTDPTSKINQQFFGSVHEVASQYGAFWHRLDETSINIRRNDDDGCWAQARIMLWTIPEP